LCEAIETKEKSAMAKQKGPKRGRPPKELAGDVETRILDAAEQLFLGKGFRSSSIDEVAERAPASKPTIYSHFPGKEALFEAVVGRAVSGLMNFQNFIPEGRTIQDKLTSIGTAIVDRALQDSIGVTRAVIAEAPTFPELSRHVHEASRDRMAEAVSQVMNDATQLARTLKGPFSPKRSVATAQIFMDLILLPILMRSLMGEETKSVRKDLPSFVRERVSFFLAACETDWSA
jgi:AcrR family transcriptional regulator